MLVTQLLFMHHFVEASKHGFAVRGVLGDPGSTSPSGTYLNLTAVMQDVLDPAFAETLRCESVSSHTSLFLSLSPINLPQHHHYQPPTTLRGFKPSEQPHQGV